MELYSRAQAPGRCLDINRRSAMHSFGSMFVCGKITILWFKKSLVLKLHSSPGEIIKKAEGGPKEYQMENNFPLASLAASSQYGRLLQEAVTV